MGINIASDYSEPSCGGEVESREKNQRDELLISRSARYLSMRYVILCPHK